MKDKVFLFIIGVLTGAVISTGVFYIYTINTNKCDCSTQTNTNQPPEMPSEQNNDNNEPPAKPDGDSTKQPTKSNDNTTNENN